MTPAARSILPLKNLFLTHGDGLAPPAFRPRLRDVRARDLGPSAFAIPHREEHVIAGGEVSRMLLPGLPLFARGASRGREQCANDQDNSRELARHECPSIWWVSAAT